MSRRNSRGGDHSGTKEEKATAQVERLTKYYLDSRSYDKLNNIEYIGYIMHKGRQIDGNYSY